MEAASLKEVPIFSTLSEEKLGKLFAKFRKKKLKEDTLIIQEGEPGKEFFIVAGGKIKIFLSYPDGREITLTILEPYGYFGELSLLDNLPRSASARTLDHSVVYTLDKDAFHEFLEENREAVFGILKATSLMVRRLTEQVYSLSFQDVRGRVARKIFELSRSVAKTDNQVFIPVSVTHQELAEMIGSARETVTRALNFFEEKNILGMDRKGIHLLLPDELQKFL